MEKSLDKDIEILKDIKEHYVMLRENGTGIHPQYERTISNVLTQLNANKYDINNYEERITSLKSELETYKKIAEKLASVLGKRGIVTLQPIPPYNDNALLETVVINGKEEIIDWARKEVEKDE